MVKTAVLNDRVQECRIYPDIYENSSNDASVEPPQPAIFLETQKDTMQVPFGIFSMLDALMDGSEKAFDAAIYLCHNAFSHWDWGVSHSLSIRFVGKLFGVVHQYVQQAHKRLLGKEWIKRLSGKYKISKFELKHHLCDDESVPLDRDGRPSKCAMPRGYGGLFERLLSGDIGWKSLLIWMLLKVHSDFTTGITEPVSIALLCKWTKFGTTTVCDCIKELEAAGMLEKLARRPQEAQTYQLYPKPYVERKKRKPEQPLTWRNMRAVGSWRHSFNELWRVNVETTDIQYRPEKNETFRRVSDYEITQAMPKKIRRDFDMAVRAYSELVAAGLSQNPCPA